MIGARPKKAKLKIRPVRTRKPDEIRRMPNGTVIEVYKLKKQKAGA